MYTSKNGMSNKMDKMLEYQILHSDDIKVMVLKGWEVHTKLSILQELTAIIGINPRVDHYNKHKLYSYKVNRDRIDEIRICPKCFEERFSE
ncbi:hypothetical protein CW706_02115 [Candidatus Bathyarchaeota archaeon]|nr:MAG: hypothetical protein CW706_02115 [Candidatus Bathyarchaeota archaeon]